ncbi:unnamed protein product [Brassica rapa subsp. narinosa]
MMSMKKGGELMTLDMLLIDEKVITLVPTNPQYVYHDNRYSISLIFCFSPFEQSILMQGSVSANHLL